MSLFSVMNVATTGLSAAQLGMDITGQNIANADVDGYSRKRLTLSSAYRWDPMNGQMGFGVEVVNIERVRNSFIDDQIRHQNESVGYFKEVDSTLETVENIFTEPGETGLLQFVNQFFDSWENLASNPADVAARTMVKTNGEILTSIFQNLAGELTDLRQTRNDEIGNRVEQVNQITAKLFNLNNEIASVEISGQKANDSRDERDRLLKELSGLIDISTTENDRGQTTVTTMGNIIVSPVDFQNLEMTTTITSRPDGTTSNDIGIRFANSKRPYIPMSGQIRGLLDARDEYIPGFQTKLDELAMGLVEKVNQLHANGYNLMGYAGVNFFDPAATGASDIKISASIESSVENIAAAQGSEVRHTIENISHVVGNPPLNLIHPNVMPANLIATNQTTGAVLTFGVDYTIDYTNGAFDLLNPAHNNMPITLEYDYYTGGFRGEGDNSNAVAIAALRTSLTMSNDGLGNPTATFDQYYSSFIGELGLNRNEAASNLESRQFLVEQYETHQDAIAGVSLDEEMAEMIKFQHTYQASAKVISTANEMLDVLMRM
jgi:flagellar hook-associated protein 1 FlgK